MRFLLIFLLLTAVVSCGKKSGGGSASADPEAQQCEVNGVVVSCDSIYDGLGVDILDAAIDVTANVSASAITFTQARSVKSQGRRIDCSISVNSGDVYHYTVSGDSLYIDMPTGNITMKRVHHNGGGVAGTWKWSGIVDGATYQTRLMTVTKSLNRVIMKTTCER